MAYIPKSPPFSAREKVIAVSLPSKIPVTSVTEVTTPRELNHLPGIDDSDLAQLVRQWLHENCVTSSHCVCNIHSLCCEFLRWAGLALVSDAEHVFANQLRTLGLRLDDSGMVAQLILATDFLAALKYERGHKGLPANERRILTKGDKTMSMIISTKPKQYELPDEGEHQSVLCDVVDLGEVDTAFGKKDKVRLIWLVDQRDSAGRQIPVACSYNKSLHEKANLRKVVKAILDRDCGETFDLEKLLGTNVRLVIEHVSQDERTFARIAAVLRPRKGDPVLAVPTDFIRSNDRNGGGNSASGTPAAVVPRPKGGNGAGTAAIKKARHPKSNVGMGAASVANSHGVDVTDKDVRFPGTDDENGHERS